VEEQRFVVMGAGAVGFYLAQVLSRQGHEVVVIENDPRRAAEVEEEIDATVVVGSGAHFGTLQAAAVDRCDLFMAVSSDDQANLSASLLAKHLGATRAVTRVGLADDVKTHHTTYEKLFRSDLLMSTQLLASTAILNYILGHSTVAVEYLAQNKIQLRRIRLEADSVLVSTQLKDLKLPGDSLVVAFFKGDDLRVPSGQDRARPGEDALILGRSEVIGQVEAFVSPRSQKPGRVVLAGCGVTGLMVAKALLGKVHRIAIIEKDRARAEELSEQLPECSILYGDATDESLLHTLGVGSASTFVAATGNDESSLMASLLAKEMGVPEVIAMVDRSQTTNLWKKLGVVNIVSPRALVHRRIETYISSGFSANIASLQSSSAQVIERQIHPESPTAGATLAEVDPPHGLIVGAVIRGERVFVPRGQHRLEVGDRVILFVEESEVPLLRLFFPGKEEE
jgi:trk system potassium uptake protein TrkA